MKCSKDFIATYNELFKFMESQGAIEDFWPILADAILGRLKQLVTERGFIGMIQYWTDTLVSEDAVCTLTCEINGDDSYFIITMKDCPSLKQLGEHRFERYCEHCDAIYGQVLERLGYTFERIGTANNGCCIRIRKGS
jgi:hypothetical protein